MNENIKQTLDQEIKGKMLLYYYEKWLSLLYPLIGALSVTCVICLAIVYHHWKLVLDTCVTSFPQVYYNEINCGCILYGKSTPTYFVGGDVAFCHWSVYGPLIPLAIAIIFGSFHVFRVCFKSAGKPTKGSTTVRQRSGDIIVMTTESEIVQDNISPYYWTPMAILAGIMTIYMFVHAVILSDGYAKTCKQYRNELVKLTHATGPMNGAIQGRLSCGAVFDFMDYLHPDVNFDRRRDVKDRIDTSAALAIALITTWLSVLAWIAVMVINIIRSRASRTVRV